MPSTRPRMLLDLLWSWLRRPLLSYVVITVRRLDYYMHNSKGDKIMFLKLKKVKDVIFGREHFKPVCEWSGAPNVVFWRLRGFWPRCVTTPPRGFGPGETSGGCGDRGRRNHHLTLTYSLHHTESSECTQTPLKYSYSSENSFETFARLSWTNGSFNVSVITTRSLLLHFKTKLS